MLGSERGPDAPTVIERVDVPSRASELTPSSDAQLRALLLAGTKVGRFRIVDALGEGGMSLVFAAHDDELDRPVALKILRTAQSDGPSRARLLREAQALARLSHPNVVTIYEVGMWSGCVFAAMELIPGQTLRDWLQASKPSMAQVLDVMIQAGRGLAAAHAAGIVHRDFKPSNVLVGSDGRTRVLDFGLAVAPGERDSGPIPGPVPGPNDGVPVARVREPSTRVNLLGETLTIAGAISGTPAYMAPEQLRGGAADVSADVYAFGVTLFESLCGRRPFAGRTLRERRAELDGRASLDIAGAPKLPARLRAVLSRCLAVDPSERHPSMNALLAELEQGVSAKRRRLALAGGVLLATLGLGYAFGYGLDDRGLAEPSDACAELAGTIDQPWSEARRQALEASFDASEVGHADAIWTRLAPRLDAYASELAAARVAACQAGARGELGEPEHAALTLCLDARALGFDRFVTELGAAEPEALARAITAFDRLARPASCSSGQAPRVPASDDPALHEQQLRLADALDEASLAAGLGRLDDALVSTRSLATRAHELGWHALEAEASLVQGRVLVELDRLDDAASVAERGLWRADRVGDDRTLAGALAVVLTVATTRDDEAAIRRWRPHGEVVLERLGPGREGELELVLALALAEAHVDPAGAGARAERALALAESLLDADDPERARAYERLGDIALRRGQLDAAWQLYARALDVYAQAFGPEHPWMVASLHRLARVAQRRGAPRQALELGERALGLAAVTNMRPSAELVALLLESGELLTTLDRLGEARGRLTEALVLGESVLGPTHPLTQRARHALEQLLARFTARSRAASKPPAAAPSDPTPSKKKREWFKKRKPKKKS